jgi:NAD(P)-dependent dehydrogenase (short-subunit alcohol dehydrogenase family)
MTTGSALIVGVGPGLGLALARAFAAAGHPVGLFGRDVARLTGYAGELEEAGHHALAFQADVTDPDELTAALRRAVDELGAPDVVVYNVGILERDRPLELDLETWTTRLAANVTGAKVTTDAVLPQLRDGRGTLLFTSGGLSVAPDPDLTSLSVGKAALRAYVHALHDDLRDGGVHATSITIDGVIDGDEPRLAADALARDYVDLHHQAADDWRPELVRP